MSDLYDDYRRMCEQWDKIVARPFSDKTRRMMCRAVLQEYLGERAVFRFRQPMPCLRFYADMLVLKHLLNPVFTREDRDFDRLAIVPLFNFVCDWVARHSEPH